MLNDADREDVSQRMSRILRSQVAARLPWGFMKIVELLRDRSLHGVTEENAVHVANSSSKHDQPRFELSHKPDGVYIDEMRKQSNRTSIRPTNKIW